MARYFIESVANNIKKYKAEKGITSEEYASLAEINLDEFLLYENAQAKKIDDETLKRIASAVGVPSNRFKVFSTEE